MATWERIMLAILRVEVMLADDLGGDGGGLKVVSWKRTRV
jgi:hypothetical protein